MIFVLFVTKRRQSKKDIYYYTPFWYINTDLRNCVTKRTKRTKNHESLEIYGFKATGVLSQLKIRSVTKRTKMR